MQVDSSSWQSLERLIAEPSEFQRSLATPIADSTPSFWERLVAFLCGTSHSEPRIQQRCDRTGQLYWSVHDPITQESHRFDSADEVRSWLDQRYYR